VGGGTIQCLSSLRVVVEPSYPSFVVVGSSSSMAWKTKHRFKLD
jgi:hypothetical protein